ncbi:type II CAAX prenyl endopeptidase Rce1 family protein [Rhodococcus erythropolis]|uniref:CPBP family glutamic-type intramembrane protease n=1 Tax=Rhodococcus erythropolis TaxID=1833 RepID=UPI00378DDA97
MTTSAPPSQSTPGRRVSVAAFVAFVIVYLAVIQGLGFLLTRNEEISYAAPTDVNQLWRSLLVPIAVSFVLVYAAVAYLRWWRPVWVDDRPVQRWLIVVPILMVVSIVVVTDYQGLADHNLTFVLLLLLTSLLVGLTEETMFRGIGVTCFRSNGFSEKKVGLWSTVIFGLAHSTNLISEGPTAFVQVLTTIVAGYFFYIIRRRTGGLLIPALVHGLWDFSLISGLTTPDHSYPLSILAIVTMMILAIVLIVRRKHIEPHTSETSHARHEASNT